MLSQGDLQSDLQTGLEETRIIATPCNSVSRIRSRFANFEAKPDGLEYL